MKFEDIPRRITFRRTDSAYFEHLLFGSGSLLSPETAFDESTDDELAISLIVGYLVELQGGQSVVEALETEFKKRQETLNVADSVIFNARDVTLDELRARAKRALFNAPRSKKALHGPFDENADSSLHSPGDPYASLNIFSDDELAELAIVAWPQFPIPHEVSRDIKYFIGAALGRF